MTRADAVLAVEIGINVARPFTASGVVLDAGQVLLVQGTRRTWWLPPGGHVEPGEDPAAAVLREVREEVGIVCEVLAEDRFRHDAVKVVPAPFTILVESGSAGNGFREHVDFIYALRPLTTEIRLRTAEIADWRWVPVAGVEALDAPPELASLVQSVYEYVASLPMAEDIRRRLLGVDSAAR